MRKYLLSLIFVLGISGITFGNDTFDPVVASVKLTETTLIKRKDFNIALELFRYEVKREITNEDISNVLNDLINSELLVQGANRESISFSSDKVLSIIKAKHNLNNEDVKLFLEREYGVPWEIAVEKLIDKFTIDRYVRNVGSKSVNSNTIPTEQDVLEYYNRNKTSFVQPDMVRLSHIFISEEKYDDKEELKTYSESVYEKIINGEDTFSNLVENLSDDSESLKYGGDIGYIYRDNHYFTELMGKDFINNVFQVTDINGYTLIKSNKGYHIITVTDKKEAKILGLEESLNPLSKETVKSYIYDKLQENLIINEMRKIESSLIKNLKKEANVKIFSRNVPTK